MNFEIDPYKELAEYLSSEEYLNSEKTGRSTTMPAVLGMGFNLKGE